MNNQEKVWKVGMWVGVLLTIFLAIISIKELKSISYVGKDTQIPNVITVNGKGEKIAIPDIATFSFGINETAKVVGEAQSKATEKINKALDALKANGIDKKDIKTISYNINPRYEYIQGICTAGSCRPGRQVLTGYEVSQTTEVKIRDITKAGALFETIGSLDVQNVNGLTFSIDDIDNVKAEARDIAIKDAKSKAKTLAKDLGVRLVRITNFYDSSDDSVYPQYAESFSVGASIKTASVPAPQIPAGEQKVISKISITYEIK